jgi:hypothetical protein
MGRTGRWKDAHAAFRELGRDSLAAVPKWARITSVGRKLGPFVSLQLEIHYADQPVHEVATSVWLPRGARPEVGQDVMYREVHGDDSTHYDIEWDQPPNYGTAATPRRDAARRLLDAKQALDRGLITRADFDRVRQSAQDGRPADDL